MKPNDEICSILTAQIPYAIGAEHITNEWYTGKWEQLTFLFNEQLEKYNCSLGEYINSLKPAQNVMGRVYFHLVENKNGKYPFAFLATYCDMNSEKAVQQPLSVALQKCRGDFDKILNLLPTVLRVAEKSSFISNIVENGEIFSPIGMTSGEAYGFLCEIPLYIECGILCRIPDWWKRHSRRVGTTVSVGEKTPSHLGMNAMLSFDVSVTLDGEKLNEDEIKLLLASTRGLAFIKSKWVEADSERLRATLSAYEKAKKLYGSREFSLK